jgi:hypothetical protein
MAIRNLVKKIAEFTADAFINLVLWLWAYVCASIAAGYTLAFFSAAITLVRFDDYQLTLGSIFFLGLFWAYAIGIVALTPAILGNGIWEIFGFWPSAKILTGLGATVGFGLSLFMASGETGPMHFRDWIFVSAFGIAGAIGGFTLGCLRTGLLASKRMKFPDVLKSMRVSR